MFAASALALVGVIFALLINPRLKDLDSVKADHGQLRSHIDTLKIADNLTALQRLQNDFAALTGRDLSTRMNNSEEAIRAVLTDIAVLKQSDAERNQRLNTAVDSLAQTIKRLESEIAAKVASGDRENLIGLLALRVDQLETSYTLSKIQGGVREEEARDRWARAKDDLARESRVSR